jgi:hypothetical protein
MMKSRGGPLGPASLCLAAVTLAHGAAGFTDVTDDLGISYMLTRPEAAGDYFMPDSMGPGCALLDFDGDGRLDLYVVAGFRTRDGRTSDERGADRLYRQRSDGRFEDVTHAAGVGDPGYGMGVAAGDIDNDGDVDLYVTSYGLDRLYRNEGDGTFVDVTERSGIHNPAWAASAGFFDHDADGFLDLFVTNYLALGASETGADAAGRPEYPSPFRLRGVPDVLYHNDGDGTFTDASAAAGIASTRGKGLGVTFLDLDADGRLDVYVANDGESNHAWIQDASGRFTDEAFFMGLAVNALGLPEAGMGVAAGDVDGDGCTDLLVTHLAQESNTLYRCLEPGLFEDATTTSGLGPPSVDFTGFGTVLRDFDLDGDLDLVVANGRVLRHIPYPGASLDAHWTPYAEPNRLFLNDGKGRFEAAAPLGRDFCADVEVSRGLAAGDIDTDGDIDVVVTNGNGTVRVYRNDMERSGSWFAVRALDPSLGRDALGALVTVTAAGGREWRRRVSSAESYLSSSEPVAHFGLGGVGEVAAIEVTWPDGLHERFVGGPADRRVTVERGHGARIDAGE